MWLASIFRLFNCQTLEFSYCSEDSLQKENWWFRLISVEAIGFLYPNIWDTLLYKFASSFWRIWRSMLMHSQRYSMDSNPLNSFPFCSISIQGNSFNTKCFPAAIISFSSYCYPNSCLLWLSPAAVPVVVLSFLCILHQFHIHCCHLLLIFPSFVLLNLLASLIIYEQWHKWVLRTIKPFQNQIL